MKFVRLWVILTNLLIFGAGVFLIVISAWARYYLKDIKQFMGEEVLHQIISVTFGIGGFLIFIGFFGCFGAFTMNYEMLSIYAFLVVLVFVASVIGIILLQIFHRSLADRAVQTLKKYGKNDTRSEQITEWWNKVQKKLNCCGVHGIGDYINITNEPPPPCSNSTQGCKVVLGSYATSIGILCIVIALIENLAILMAWEVCNDAKMLKKKQLETSGEGLFGEKERADQSEAIQDEPLLVDDRMDAAEHYMVDGKDDNHAVTEGTTTL